MTNKACKFYIRNEKSAKIDHDQQQYSKLSLCLRGKYCSCSIFMNSSNFKSNKNFEMMIGIDGTECPSFRINLQINLTIAENEN